jgi:hypothetical protein
MTRTEARKVARTMVRSGRFRTVDLVEDMVRGECRVVAQNRAWRERTVSTLADWETLQAWDMRPDQS